jgi:hypothetical protein
MALGTHNATFTVGTADVAGNVLQQKTFNVTLQVDPHLEIGQQQADRNYIFGDVQRVFPIPISVTAANRQWNATSTASWLKVPATTQSGSGTLNASIDITGLAPGTYFGQLDVVNAALPGDWRTHNFRVEIAPADMFVQQTEFVFGGEDGRSAPAARPLYFALSTGQGVHPYTVSVRTDSGGNWLQPSSTSGQVGYTGNTVTLSVNRGQLPGGTYTGEVSLSTDVYGTVFSRTLPVTFNVEASRLVVSSAGVALSRVNGRSVLARTLKVFSSSGSTTTPWNATSDSPWLTVTASGVSGGSLVLTAAPGSLASGTTHFANVTITSPDAFVENQQSVRVGLYLSNDVPASAAPMMAARSGAASPVEPLFAVGVGGSVNLYDVYSTALVRSFPTVVAEPGQMTFSEDGRTLFVHDVTNVRVTQLDVATGAVVATFPTPPMQYQQGSGGGIAVFRPNGHPTLVTPNVHFYDLTTRAEIPSGSYSLPAHNSFSPSPDQSMLATQGATAFKIVRSALRGGEMLFDPVFFVFPVTPSDRESCFSPDGSRLYSGTQGQNVFAAASFPDRQLVQQLPADFYPNAIKCVWNGLVIGGLSASYRLTDIFVYDAPSGIKLADRNSDLSDGMYYPNRLLADRGLTVSGDGTRLLSIWFSTSSNIPVGVGFQTLPPPL